MHTTCVKEKSIMFLSFQTHRPKQTGYTQIRQLLEEWPDQGLHCLPFYLHLLIAFLYISDNHFLNVPKYKTFAIVTSLLLPKNQIDMMPKVFKLSQTILCLPSIFLPLPTKFHRELWMMVQPIPSPHSNLS